MVISGGGLFQDTLNIPEQKLFLVKKKKKRHFCLCYVLHVSLIPCGSF